MSTQATAKLSYEAAGKENLESVVNNIFSISPEETPFLTNFGATKAEATNHEWVEDALATTAENKHIEGASYTIAKATSGTRKTNYTQIFATVFGVSKTQEAVKKAGMASEVAYQKIKKLKEHKRAIEFALVSATGNAGASGTARSLKGARQWIVTNAVTASAAGSAVSEDTLNTLLQTIWSAGGTPNTIYVNGTQKTAMSNFSGRTGSRFNVDATTVSKMVSIYESNFGTMKIELSRDLGQNEVFVLDNDLWKVATLRKTTIEELAKTSSGHDHVIETELTLEARNENGNGKITMGTA